METNQALVFSAKVCVNDNSFQGLVSLSVKFPSAKGHQFYKKQADRGGEKKCS